MKTGLVHSIESFGTLDGPGIRTVVFLQGCPNRCKYCHNVDCAISKGGTEYTSEEVVEEVMKNKEYWKDGENTRGGVTFSGGEPLSQSEFLLECVRLLKKNDVHVVIDTSATAEFENIKALVPFVDLWMISVKHMDDDVHKELVGRSNVEILNNIKDLDKLLTKEGKRIRIRFVIIPGITDAKEHIEKLGSYIKGIKNLERVELLPYSTIGKQKWIEIFGHYSLEGIPEASNEDVEKVKKILSSYVDRF
ncbi:pyruvate formate-lyase-activating protein [Candidatus Dojkabacteria bacterium]|jgi:pyruvate formate lyase activating enzyme|nr:pyruvate formate-lyase-activating protein [Candidatus Dojkabacteria bacterium]